MSVAARPTRMKSGHSLASKELLAEPGPGNFPVRHGPDEQRPRLAAKRSEVLAGQPGVLTGAHLRGRRGNARDPVLSAGEVLSGEFVRIKAAHGQHGIDSRLDASNGRTLDVPERGIGGNAGRTDALS